MPQFSNEDVVAHSVRSVRQEGDSFISASTCLVQEEPALSEIQKELLAFSDKDKIPSVIGTDANITQYGVSPTLIQEGWNYSCTA